MASRTTGTRAAGSSGGLQLEGDLLGRPLTVGEVDGRRHRPADGVVLRVRGHADHLGQRDRRADAQLELPADHAGVAEQLPRERLVDDRHGRRLRRVGRREAAPAQHRDAHRAVKVVVDHQPRRPVLVEERAPVRPGPGGATPGGVAMPPEPSPATSGWLESEAERTPGMAPSRSSAAAYRCASPLVVVPVQRGIDLEQQDVRRVEPGVNALEVPDRIDQQSRGRHEEHREGDLNDDERARQSDAALRAHRAARPFLKPRGQRDVGRAE